MAQGVTGYLDFEASKGFTLRVHYAETYDIATNKSDSLTITKIQIYSGQYGNTYWHYLDGTISVDGTPVVTMNSSTTTHKALISVGSWVDCSGTLGSVSNISHAADGSKNVSISVNVTGYAEAWAPQVESGSGWTVSSSQNVALTTIPRASEITSAGNVTLGNGCHIKWTPKAASFRYRLKFSLGNWSYTTGAIHPNKTTEYTYSGYTIPLDVAEQIPNAKTGTMKVELYSYSDSGATVQIGSTDSDTFTVTVPDNNSTKPAVTMSLSSVSTLASKFAGLYIQGKTKVKASLNAEGKYKATIKGYSMKVEATTYDSDDGYTSDYLNTPGSVRVYGYANDSRGFTGSTYQDITVIGYTGPKILPVSGESDVVAARCDANGNLKDDGTYLKIKAKRSYSPVTSGGAQKNFCQIRFRYKLESAPDYSDWTTILAGDNLSSDEIVTGALLGGVLSTSSSYMVQVQAVDDIGESATTTVAILTEAAYMHRTKNAMGLGKYVEGENLLDVAWDTHLRGEVRIGAEGKTLREYILAVISEGG